MSSSGINFNQKETVQDFEYIKKSIFGKLTWLSFLKNCKALLLNCISPYLIWASLPNWEDKFSFKGKKSIKLVKPDSKISKLVFFSIIPSLVSILYSKTEFPTYL